MRIALFVRTYGNFFQAEFQYVPDINFILIIYLHLLNHKFIVKILVYLLEVSPLPNAF